MGVPAFFRWLAKRYGKIIVDVIEPNTQIIDDVEIPEDTSQPNPNGMEFDNFYLDMNNIIHNCTHPEDKNPPSNEDEMMMAISEGVERLFSIVRPRKLLMIAIDGVAPRAKMNQQRSRRFRSAQEAEEQKEVMKRVNEEMQANGLKPAETKQKWDTNAITPGTAFMEKVTDWLHFWVASKISSDPGWKNVRSNIFFFFFFFFGLKIPFFVSY